MAIEKSELPESWQRALDEQVVTESEPAQSAASTERTPIQPPFRIWHGLYAATVPLLALCLAFGVAKWQHSPLPNWPGAALFLAVLCGGNGFFLSRAIGPEHQHERFAGDCVLAGFLSIFFFLIPGATEVYLSFLVIFVLSQCVSRTNGFTVFILAMTIGLAILFIAALNYALRGAVLLALENQATPLILALIAACPFAHSLCTAALPAEKTLFGRLDAMMTGVSASLMGMFWAMATYRLLLAMSKWLPHQLQESNPEWIQFAVIVGALQAGNWVCVRQLFKAAYSAREERPIVVRKT